MTEETDVTRYQYDAAYRLVHVQYPEIAGASGVKNNGSTKGKGKKKGHQVEAAPTSVSYVYDAAGNRLSKSDEISTIDYSYNEANQLLQAGDITYSYDVNGNRVTKQGEEGTSQYFYNSDNFLVQFNDPENNVTVYGYDAMNRRVYKSKGTKKKDVTAYLYDGLEVLQEVTGNNANKITAYYRANGRIVTQQKYNVSQGHNNRYQNRPEGRQLFYAYDGLGSVAALSNHQGKLKTRYQYDAFGEVLAGDLSDNPYAFTGQRLDPESGLYHFHFRKYDAEIGVWTTADPLGVAAGINLYIYVNNNPLNITDLLGLHTGGYGGPEQGDEMASGDISDGPENTNDSHSNFYDDHNVFGYGQVGYYGNIVGVINDTKIDEVIEDIMDFFFPPMEERKEMAKQFAAPRLKMMAEAYELQNALPTSIGGFLIDGFQRRSEGGTNQCHGRGWTTDQD
jgi:RHS repeat-associated protein